MSSCKSATDSVDKLVPFSIRDRPITDWGYWFIL